MEKTMLTTLTTKNIKNSAKEKVLIHTCCADCLSKIISAGEFEVISGKNIGQKLKIDNLEISLLFYNPNIHPRTEMMARYEALKFVVANNPQITKLITADWSPKEYFDVVKSPLNRCPSCWNLRLSRTFEEAKKLKCKYISTTLLTSHYQDSDTIKRIGLTLAEKYEIDLLQPLDIKEDCCSKGFYKQNYCGCIYSLMERYEEKYLNR